MKQESHFDSYINSMLAGRNKSFIIEETNSSKIVVSNKKKNYGAFWRNRLTDEQMKNLWIFKSVKASFLKYIQNNPEFKIYPEAPSIIYNHENINNLKRGDEFLATDAKHCYWRVAFLLGYINQKLYDRLKVAEYKLERNKAMACVCSTKTTHIYKRGKLVDSKTTCNEELRHLYYNVRKHSHYLVGQAAKSAGKNLIKFKIDCVYYPKQYKEKIEGIFEKNNLLFETNLCTHIGNGEFIEKKKVIKL